jgi:hypothetical protein
MEVMEWSGYVAYREMKEPKFNCQWVISERELPHSHSHRTDQAMRLTRLLAVEPMRQG